MDSTNHPHTLRSPAPDGRRRWTKAIETGLLVVLAVAVCLTAALGLVAIGLFIVLVFGMNNFGSNK
ncbi:MAG TPA: hypothetical protein VE198_21815 [Actinoallomurus sp.]|jgi:hypothetical protein|nr:hypothetical protein [Actinoallomurus sp.]